MKCHHRQFYCGYLFLKPTYVFIIFNYARAGLVQHRRGALAQ
jgi:hypothetical protein